MKRKRNIVKVSDIRRKNVAEYFVSYSKPLREWLYKLVAEYKRIGDYPLFPSVLLSSYYEDRRDKEIACFVGSLIYDELMRETGGKRKNAGDVIKNVSEMREMIGVSPFDWFNHRRYVNLTSGLNLEKWTGGVKNWRIAKLMDYLYGILHRVEVDDKGYGHYVFPCIEAYFMEDKSRLDAISDLYYQKDYNINLLLHVLSSSGGFSIGVWSITPLELKSPLTHEFRQFIKTWFPEYRYWREADDAIRLFGFEGNCDLFYAWLAWRKLAKRNPDGCKRLATIYTNRYERCAYRIKVKWEDLFPPIDLE